MASLGQVNVQIGDCFLVNICLIRLKDGDRGVVKSTRTVLYFIPHLDH